MSWPEGLARMHDIVAIIIIDEEVAVLAVIKAAEDTLHLGLCRLVISPGLVIDRANGRNRKVGEVQKLESLSPPAYCVQSGDTGAGEGGADAV